jgi:hypothetical protein
LQHLERNDAGACTAVLFHESHRGLSFVRNSAIGRGGGRARRADHRVRDVPRRLANDDERVADCIHAARVGTELLERERLGVAERALGGLDDVTDADPPLP